MGGAHEVSVKEFGFPTRLIECDPGTELGLTQTTIFRNNPDRVFWFVSNLGAGDVYVAHKRQVASTHGTKLAALGGYASMTAREDGEAVGYDLFGLATVANNDIYFLSIEKEPRKVA